MGQETMGKKEREKKKRQKKQQKLEKKQERKEQNNKGKSLDDMMVYLDEYGNLVDSPPDPNSKVEIKAEDIRLGAAPLDPSEIVRKGTVTHFNDEKGYGFIRDKFTGNSVFVHVNDLVEEIKPHDKVTFEQERGPKGMVAKNVQKVK